MFLCTTEYLTTLYYNSTNSKKKHTCATDFPDDLDIDMTLIYIMAGNMKQIMLPIVDPVSASTNSTESTTYEPDCSRSWCTDTN